MRKTQDNALIIQLNDLGMLDRLDDLRHLGEELLRWNKTHNLTAYQSWPEIAASLFADSLVVASFCKGESCLDIGSGAGFPGLMIGLTKPYMQVTLLDARRKRVSFQQHARRMLALPNIKPVWGRAGNKKDPLNQERFATVTCKALASLPQAMSLCQMYVRRGGTILLPRGIGDMDACQHLCGQAPLGWCFKLHRYKLEGVPGERLLLIGNSENVSRETLLFSEANAIKPGNGL